MWIKSLLSKSIHKTDRAKAHKRSHRLSLSARSVRRCPRVKRNSNDVTHTETHTFPGKPENARCRERVLGCWRYERPLDLKVLAVFFCAQDSHSSIFSLPPPKLVIQATATFNFPMVQKHLNQSTATRARRRARLRGCSDPTLVCLAALSWIVAVSLLRKIVLVACPVVRCLLLTRIILSHRTQTKQRRRRC